MPRPNTAAFANGQISLGEKLTEIRSVRLSKRVADAWDAKVDLSGYTASEFFRLAIIDNQSVVSPAKIPRLRQKDLSSESEREILFLLQRQSANINQLAHSVNVAKLAGSLDSKLFVEVLEELQKIEARAGAIMARVF